MRVMQFGNWRITAHNFDAVAEVYRSKFVVVCQSDDPDRPDGIMTVLTLKGYKLADRLGIRAWREPIGPEPDRPSQLEQILADGYL